MEDQELFTRLLSSLEYGAMGLSNLDIIKLVQHLKIPDFRGVFMRDTVPDKPREKECGILNLNKSSEPGSHWVVFFKDEDKRIYFDYLPSGK